VYTGIRYITTHNFFTSLSKWITCTRNALWWKLLKKPECSQSDNITPRTNTTIIVTRQFCALGEKSCNSNLHPFQKLFFSSDRLSPFAYFNSELLVKVWVFQTFSGTPCTMDRPIVRLLCTQTTQKNLNIRVRPKRNSNSWCQYSNVPRPYAPQTTLSN
jgi:hypothetical protein